MIDDGAFKEDFITELLGIYPKEECLTRERELAMTSLFPKGLNGNAGKHIEMTKEVMAKISIANKGVPKGPLSEETKTKMRASLKRKDFSK